MGLVIGRESDCVKLVADLVQPGALSDYLYALSLEILRMEQDLEELREEVADLRRENGAKAEEFYKLLDENISLVRAMHSAVEMINSGPDPEKLSCHIDTLRSFVKTWGGPCEKDPCIIAMNEITKFVANIKNARSILHDRYTNDNLEVETQ